MNAKVGFKEVQAYAQTHNVDFKTAAKQLGLSAQDAAKLEQAFNGGANWGQVMDEVTFHPEKAEQYIAEVKEKQAQDVKDHPEKYQPKRFNMRSGRYVVYQKDTQTGKATYKYYAQDGTQMKEADFKKQEYMGDRVFVYDEGSNKLFEQNKKDDKPFFNFTDENGNFSFKETAFTAVKTVLAPLGLLTSCSGDEVINNYDEVNFNNNITVTIPKNDQQAIIDAMNKGFKALQEELKNLGYTVEKYGDQIVQLLVDNNKNLVNIKNELTNQGTKNDEIIKMLTNINNTVSTLTEITAGISGDVKVNGESVKGQLDAILKAINSNSLSVDGLAAQMDKIQELLKQVINNQDTSLIFQENSNINEKKILDAIENLKYADENKQLAGILEILKDIKGIANSIDSKLDTVINNLEKQFGNDGDIKKLLEKIQKDAEKTAENTTTTNQLLTQISDMIKQLGDDGKEMGKEILNYIAAVGFEMNRNFGDLITAVKEGKVGIDEVTKMLEKINANVVKNGEDGKEMGNQILNYLAAIGFEMNGGIGKILDAINNSKGGDTKGIEALLKEVLSQLNSMDNNNKQNFKAVIDAIGDIAAGGGTVDLSKVENLLKQLVELNKANGVKLDTITKQNETIITLLKAFKSNVDASLKQINDSINNIEGDVTEVKGFLGKLEAKLNAILDKLGNGGSCQVDFDTLMAKLNEILDAIKDHEVKVDVTGKVTCECKCGGGKHEGILGDLDNILG